jgi:electron transfer flavoprotein alpha subunit
MNAIVLKQLRLPADVASQITDTAGADERSQNAQAVVLIKLGLAGRARMKEIEKLAAETIAAATGAANTSAADHLAEHRRLTGITEESI